eukprot:6114015-Prymnesium_polylepis.1
MKLRLLYFSTCETPGKLHRTAVTPRVTPADAREWSHTVHVTFVGVGLAAAPGADTLGATEPARVERVVLGKGTASVRLD